MKSETFDVSSIIAISLIQSVAMPAACRTCVHLILMVLGGPSDQLNDNHVRPSALGSHRWISTFWSDSLNNNQPGFNPLTCITSRMATNSSTCFFHNFCVGSKVKDLKFSGSFWSGCCWIGSGGFLFSSIGALHGWEAQGHFLFKLKPCALTRNLNLRLKTVLNQLKSGTMLYLNHNAFFVRILKSYIQII